MPGKGYRSITLKEETHALLEAIREKENRVTIPETIHHVTEVYNKKLEGGESAA